MITHQDLQRLNELINTIDKFKAKNSKEIDRFINSKEVSDEINYATYDSYFKYLTNSTQIFQKFMSDYTTAYSKNKSAQGAYVCLV